MAEQLFTSTSTTNDVLLSGSSDVNTVEAVVKTGQNIAKWEVVAMETATGKIVTFNEAGAGGAEVALYIAAYAVDATAADKTAQFYASGTFNKDLVVFSGTPTDAQKAVAFTGSPILLQTLAK